MLRSSVQRFTTTSKRMLHTRCTPTARYGGISRTYAAPLVLCSRILLPQQIRFYSEGQKPGWVHPQARMEGYQGEGDALQKYTRDLTQQAKDGKLDPVIGRGNEIRRTLQVLSRRTKNNPVLIGEPGVGKTAIAEGIAQRIVANEVPEGMKNKRVLSLDLAALVAGAKFRGEFEERMKDLLTAVAKNSGDVILFIDELHTLVGAGAAEGSMDASNMLKPMLARGELHCVGATTIAEYRKYIEKDAALARRFQPVLVPEPSVEDSISILRGLKEKYEVHHGITFQDASLVAAVELSTRYIQGRFLPDKAIDLMDEAASRLRLQQESKPEYIENLDRRIITLKIEIEALKKETDKETVERREKLQQSLKEIQMEANEKTGQWNRERETLQASKTTKEKLEKARSEFLQAQREGNLARASELKFGIIPALEAKLNDGGSGGSNATLTMLHEAVTPDDIATVVANTTGIPISSLLLGERERLIHMEKYLEKSVVGQAEAITAVSNAVRVSRAGLNAHDRPLGSFLMLGPTGVGKTQLCRSLADFLFDSPQSLIRIDMSEYMEKHSVSRLIGAPPGYIGYEEGGTLTEAVRRNPYSLILLDEFEKAHREVANLLLQLLDDGHLTDSQGHKVDFRNTLIVMTSNIGADILAALPEGSSSSSAKGEVLQRVQATLQPEFINRLDELILFNRLSRGNMDAIADIQLQQVQQLLAKKKIGISISNGAKQLLADKGYDPVYGARPLKRVIQQNLMNPLASHILDESLVEGDIVEVVSEGDELVLQKDGEPFADLCEYIPKE